MDKYWLSMGHHHTAAEGRCAMEWVSYLAGEPHSDTPKCVSEYLSAFCMWLNDRLNDTERQKLRPYLARTIGTANDGLDPARAEAMREFLAERGLFLQLKSPLSYAVAAIDTFRFDKGDSPEPAFALLERLLPTVPVQLPAVSLEEASAVCGVDVVCS